MRRIFGLAFLLPAVSLADCFSQVGESIDASNSVTSPKTSQTREYLNERYRVNVDVRGWTMTDFDTGKTLRVDTQGRTYRESSLQQMLRDSTESAQHLKKLGGKLPLPPLPKPTGKKLKFGGVTCDEAISAMKMDMGQMKMTIETFTCASTQEPAAFFPLARLQAQKFNKHITPAVKADLEKISASMPPALKSMFENASKQAPSFTVQTRTPPPKFSGGGGMAAMFGGKMKESRTTLKSWGTECPPSKYLSAPADFRAEKSSR